MADSVDIDLYDEELEPEFNQEGDYNHDGVDLYDDVITAPAADDRDQEDSDDYLTHPEIHEQKISPSSGLPGQGAKRLPLYIGNLTWWTSDQDITDSIVALGINDLNDIKFYENRANGQSKGFCVVSLGSEQSSRTVLEKLPKKELHGQTPIVTHCNRQTLNQFEMQSRKPGQGPPNPPPPLPGARTLPPMGPPRLPLGPPLARRLMPPPPFNGPPRPSGPLLPHQLQVPPPNFHPDYSQLPPGMRPSILPPPIGHPPPPRPAGTNHPPPPGIPGSLPLRPTGPPPPGLPPPHGIAMRAPLPDTRAPPPRPDWTRPPNSPLLVRPGYMNQPPPIGPPPPGPPPMRPPPSTSVPPPGLPPPGLGPAPAPHVNPAFFPPPNSGQPPPSVLPPNSQGAGDIYGRQPPPGQYGDYRAVDGRGTPSHYGDYRGSSDGRNDGMPPISEAEFDEIMTRNRSVSSSAIARAVSDASNGEYAAAIETLVTAISLIKQSKVANDERCKILISSLQDTLHGIESKSYGSRGKERPRSRERSRERERSSHRDREKGRSRRERSRSRDREYRERSRDRDRYHDERYREKDRDRERERDGREHRSSRH